MIRRLSSSTSLLGVPRLSHFPVPLRANRWPLQRSSSTCITYNSNYNKHAIKEERGTTAGAGLRRYSSNAWGTDLNFPILDERPIDADGDQPRQFAPLTILIDGTTLTHRHAAPRLTIGHQPVGALYGVTRMLTRMMKYLQKAEYCVVIYESIEVPSRRRDIISNYKSNRVQAPHELQTQFHLIPSANEALNLSTVHATDCEASDLIASYCKSALESGHRVIIVGDDKDLLQLVGPQVTLYQPQKEELMGEPEVRAKYGVAPSQVPDLLALAGEKSDSIPAVPGVTPKIAVGLLEQFGSLPAILNDVDSIENTKQRARLKEYSHRASQSLIVTTLQDNLPLPVPLEDLKTRPMEKEKLISFLQKYSFRAIENSLNREYGMNFLNNEGLNPYGKPPANYEPPVFEQQYEEGTLAEEEEGEVEDIQYEQTELDLEFEQLASAMPPLSDEQMRELTPEGVTVVRNREHAREVKAKLLSLTDRYHGIDTETHMIDLKRQSPVGHGFVMCVSIYCGPDVDFGNGPRLWIDNLDECEGTLDEFKDYFENADIKKVWHNYGFDRHVIYNHGIDVTGFGGDTMHMARLWDASRMNRGGYSLEALSAELLSRRKVSMKDLFGHPKIRKDGTEGAEVILPPLATLQRDPKHVKNFIRYSTYDAEATWLLRKELESKLRAMTWNKGTTMWDFYNQLYPPFYFDILTNMEREGMLVNTQYLAEVQVQAERDADANCERFFSWAATQSEEARNMNLESDTQKQHFIYAPCINKFTREEMPPVRVFEYENVEGLIEPGKAKARRKLKFSLNGLGMPPISYTLSGWPSVDSATMSILAGRPKEGKYGKFYDHFVNTLGKSEQQAKEACEALESLLGMFEKKTFKYKF